MQNYFPVEHVVLNQFHFKVFSEIMTSCALATQ